MILTSALQKNATQVSKLALHFEILSLHREQSDLQKREPDKGENGKNLAKMQDFKKRYPFVKWKKRTFVQSLVSWIHTIIYFVCPVFNLILFLAINFFIGDDVWDKTIKQNAESF